MTRRRRLVKRSALFPRAVPAAEESTSATAAEHSSATAKATAATNTSPPFQNDKSQSVLVYSSTTRASTASAAASSSVAAHTTTTTTRHQISTLPAPSKSSTPHSNTTSTSTAVAASDSTNGSSTISGGAIGAIVAIIVIILMGVSAYFFVRRRQKRGVTVNNRLTRFSMGPTYNATSSYNNNPQSANYLEYPSPPPMSQPYQQQQPPPSMQQQPMQQQQQSMFMQQQQHPTITIAAPVTVDSGAAHEPMSATIITTPTGTDPDQGYWQQKPIGTFIVAAGYTPTLSDEVEVRPGDHVQVLVEYDDGWCMGTNLTTGGQAQGVFPRQCLGPLAQSNITTSSPTAQNRHVDSTISNRNSSLYGNPPPSTNHAY